MKLSQRILDFYKNLSLPDHLMPDRVAVLNPYHQAEPIFWDILKSFYEKFYFDEEPRSIILGINPGRLGAGATGIPFTDSYALSTHCNIEFPTPTRETSAAFVYKLIEAYGGVPNFYQDWFIGAACPLGFVRKNDKGNWVNWNYYDQPALLSAVRPFIDSKLKEQSALCGAPKKAIVFGNGKNFKYLTQINKELKLFEELIPLEHPRYVMQYKQKLVPSYVDKFVEVLKASRP